MVGSENAPYTLSSDQKAAQIMLYTNLGVYWGEVVVAQQIRVSTWLRTTAAPESITLYNAKALITTHPGQPKPIGFQEMHIFANQVLAYHLMPPQQDPLDYDPSEPNRKMVSVTALIGSFRLDGSMRMSTISNLRHYLDITREMFTPLYDVKITNTILTGMGAIKVPYVLLRQATSILAVTND